MASMGKGFWLDPDDNAVYPVDAYRNRHEWWLLDADNQRKVNLRQNTIDALNKLKVQADDAITNGGAVPADEIRMIGLRAGMIRVRDWRNNIVVQFHASRSRVRNVLWSIFMGLDKALSPHPNAEIVIDNIATNDSVRLSFKQFQKKLVSDETIMRESVEKRPPVKDLPLNDPMLEDAVSSLLGEGPYRD